jgi:hypothetical protein
MVRLSNLPDDATIAAHRGVIDYYEWKGVPVARAWPRYKAYPPTPGMVESQNVFSTVAKATGSISPAMQELWKSVPTTPGTTWVDLFRNNAMGGDWMTWHA